LKQEELKKLEEVPAQPPACARPRDEAVEEQNADTLMSRMRKLDEMAQEEIDVKPVTSWPSRFSARRPPMAHETLTSHVEKSRLMT